MAGRLEVDFYGESPENKNAILLRHAFVAIPLRSLLLQAGQTSDLISPLVPRTVNYSAALGAGNIGYRRPQVKLSMQRGLFFLGISLARSISGDLDGDTIVDGEASGVPAVQGRLATDAGVDRVQVGVSAHYGKCGCPTKDVDYSNWSASADARLELSPGVVLLGEAYTGANLGSYGGTIYNNDGLDGVHSRGGWANLQYQFSETTDLSVGWGVDDVDASDLRGLADVRIGNSLYFAAAFYEFLPDVLLGLELSRWATKYGNPGQGMEPQPTDFRLQWAIQGNF